MSGNTPKTVSAFADAAAATGRFADAAAATGRFAAEFRRAMEAPDPDLLDRSIYAIATELSTCTPYPPSAIENWMRRGDKLGLSLSETVAAVEAAIRLNVLPNTMFDNIETARAERRAKR